MVRRRRPYEHLNYSDLWHSKDGKHWTLMESDTIWSARHEHSALVFHDRIWVIGGKRDVHDLQSPAAGQNHAEALASEVWTLYIPRNWFGD